MLRTYWKEKPIIVITVGVIAIAGIFFVYQAVVPKGAKVSEGIVNAEIKTVVQEVSVTGRVEPASLANLAFDRSGRVASVPVSVGDTVYQGQILMTLEAADILAKLSGARADVAAAEARLAELVRGTRPEELEVKKAEVEKAQQTYNQAIQSLVDSVRDSYTKADDALRAKIDQFFDNADTLSPQVTFLTSYEHELETGRVTAGSTLTTIENRATNIHVSSNIVSDAEIVRNEMTALLTFLDTVSFAVNSLKPSSSLTQATIDGYKTDVATARTNINTALKNLSASQEELVLGGNSLALVKEQLTLLEAGAAQEELDQQSATVLSKQALVNQYLAELEKTRIRAPFKGTITKLEFEEGEIATAGGTAVSVISPSAFKVTAYVPEADIAKVSLGDSATLTLDAYGSSIVFSAQVLKIDPAETVLEGVSTYKVELLFADEDGRVKSGMTANIDITTGIRDDVLAIPTRAIFTKNGRQFTRIQRDDGSIEEVEVETGLRGSYGDTEIIRGISEGDKIVVFLEE